VDVGRRTISMADYTPTLDLASDVGLELDGEDWGDDDGRIRNALEGPIYSHGYSLRVMFTSSEKALRALELAGWSSISASWIRSTPKGCERWVIRGSTFLTQRRPRNGSLPLMKLNKKWKTRFYSVQVERRDDGYRLDLHGVRRADVERLIEGIMLLSKADYVIEHYRAAERFFALPAHEAMALGAALGQEPCQGKGRIAAKQFMVKDFSIPVTIKKRSTRQATLNVYRIAKGATCAFKVEIRLAGKTRDRGKLRRGRHREARRGAPQPHRRARSTSHRQACQMGANDPKSLAAGRDAGAPRDRCLPRQEAQTSGCWR